MIHHRTENKWKRALYFTLSLLPIALVGGFFTLRYQFDFIPREEIEAALAQVGGHMWLVYAITILQTVLYAAVCGFFGYILADGLGLAKPFKLTKKPLIATAILSLSGCGALALLDTFVFAPTVGGNMIVDSARYGLTLDAWIASLLYGGVIEEVMLRLFFLSLVAWLLRKLFCKGKDTESLPSWLFVAANIIAALLFAAAHLPATAVLFGKLTPVLLLRCFLLNGGLALGFGWLYRKYNIGYAMLAHAGVHICSKVLFLLIL
jgi:branched-subunit amino acid transport protein